MPMKERIDPVFPGDGAQFIERGEFSLAWRQRQRFGQADARRDHRVNESVQAGEAQLLQHLRRLARIGADVAMDKIIRRLQGWGGVECGRSCREFRHGAKLEPAGRNASGFFIHAVFIFFGSIKRN